MAVNMKKQIVGMDALERKHYEQKISKLDEEIEMAGMSKGQRIAVDDLMRKVGLSPRLKEHSDKLTEASSAITNLSLGLQ